MINSIKEWYFAVSKKWLTLFLLSNASVFLCHFVGLLPRANQVVEGTRLLYALWSVCTFVLVTVSGYQILKPLVKSYEGLSYQQRISSLQKDTAILLAILSGLSVILFFVAPPIESLNQSGKRFFAFVFLLIAGLLLLTLMGMFNLFLAKKVQNKLKK